MSVYTLTAHLQESAVHVSPGSGQLVIRPNGSPASAAVQVLREHAGTGDYELVASVRVGDPDVIFDPISANYKFRLFSPFEYAIAVSLVVE